MIPTEGWGVLRDAGDRRRFSSLMFYSTSFNRNSGKFAEEFHREMAS